MAYSHGFSNPFGFAVTPWVKRLIIANVAVFFLTLIAPALVGVLQFQARQLIPFIWTPITYMFVHGGFWHLLFNMLMLFFFGPPLEERWGSTEFLKFFLLAGLGGALLSIMIPYPIVGASAAVYGIMVAYAMFWPDNLIYFWGIFPIKAKWLVTFLVVLSLVSAVSGAQSNIAHLAHLGGAITAFLYLKSPFAPPAWGSVPAGRARRGRVGDALAGLIRPARNEERDTQPLVHTPRRREPPRPGDDVDRILDKISKGGLSSLTPEERQRLEEASKKFRAN